MDILSVYETSSESSDSTSYFNYSQYVTSSFSGVSNSSLGHYISSYNTNNSGSSDTGVHVMQDAERHRIIIIAVIMAFTLLGNLTLIFVLLCKRSRRIKRVNILLVNLAIGDVAVALFVNSTEIFFIAFGDWSLGPLMCKVSVYVQMICLSSTTNLLTSMSIDRYQVIVKPMQSLAKRPRIWLKIAIAWTISLILPIPQLFIFLQYNDGVKYDGTPKRICGSKGYTAQWQRKAYFTFTTVYILVIPIIIMMYCYVKIIRVVWVRAKNESRRRPSCLIPPRPPATTPTPDAPPKQISESYEKGGVRCGCDGSDMGSVASSPVVSWAKSVKENKDSNDNAAAGVKKKVMDFSDDSHPGSPRMSVRRSLVTASKRRALIMTLSVVISFLVCHLPYFIVNLIRIYSEYQVKLDSLKVFSEFMVMVHSTLNPILYGLFTLRQYHLKYLFSFVTCSRGPAANTTAAHGGRQRQSSSDERHQLLNTVKSKLALRSHSGDVRVKSLTRSAKKGQKKSFRREQHPNQAASTTAAVMIVSSPSSTLPQPSSSISILNKFRFKQLPGYSKKKRVQFRGKQHNDTLLFANSDAISLKNKRRKKSLDPENSDMEISASSSVIHQDMGGSLITNTHILRSNGSSPSASLVGASNVNFRKHGGVSDMTQNSRFTNVDDAEAVRRHKSIPWTPQDDEYIIGGLTRV